MLERISATLLCWALFALVVAVTLIAAVLALAILVLAGIVRLLQGAIAALLPICKGIRNA